MKPLHYRRGSVHRIPQSLWVMLLSNERLLLTDGIVSDNLFRVNIINNKLYSLLHSRCDQIVFGFAPSPVNTHTLFITVHSITTVLYCYCCVLVSIFTTEV